MAVYYVLPIILLAVIFAYVNFARKQALAAAANMSPEEAAQKFHAFYASYFDLESDERIVGAWSGLEYQGAKSSARQAAGAALNSAAGALVGVSTYVPQVFVGLTSKGRVLVSREYSELGERGNYKQIAVLAPGTQAVGAATALEGGDPGAVPKNPFNPAVSLEFVELRSPSGEAYGAWMSPQGGRMGHSGFVSIFQGLAG